MTTFLGHQWAEAGVSRRGLMSSSYEMPAFAGMTENFGMRGFVLAPRRVVPVLHSLAWCSGCAVFPLFPLQP